MAKVQHWLLLRPDGSIAAQLKIEGERTPSETGDNPEALREMRVARHGEPQHERWDAANGKWVSDKAKKERAARRAEWATQGRGHLAEMLMDRMDELEARITALEGKGA